VPHFASLNLSDEEFEKLDRVVREYLRTSRPKFLRAIALQFSEQCYSGATPDWPTQFVVKPGIDKGKLKGRSRTKTKPAAASRKKKAS